VRRLFAPAIAIAIGLVVLLGYFLPDYTTIAELRIQIVHWAVILAGVAVLVGVFNLFFVHIEKIRKKQKGSVYSLLLIAALFATFILGLALGPDHSIMRSLFDAVILPVETSLMAILAVTLVYASMRLTRRRSDLMAIIFIITALIILLGTAPLPLFEIPMVGDIIHAWIVNVPAAAGARGILLGVALGTLMTGLRILFGADRPYGGK